MRRHVAVSTSAGERKEQSSYSSHIHLRQPVYKSSHEAQSSRCAPPEREDEKRHIDTLVTKSGAICTSQSQSGISPPGEPRRRVTGGVANTPPTPLVSLLTIPRQAPPSTSCATTTTEPRSAPPPQLAHAATPLPRRQPTSARDSPHSRPAIFPSCPLNHLSDISAFPLNRKPFTITPLTSHLSPLTSHPPSLIALHTAFPPFRLAHGCKRFCTRPSVT